jgi:hypothetical protein
VEIPRRTQQTELAECPTTRAAETSRSELIGVLHKVGKFTENLVYRMWPISLYRPRPRGRKP